MPTPNRNSDPMEPLAGRVLDEYGVPLANLAGDESMTGETMSAFRRFSRVSVSMSDRTNQNVRWLRDGSSGFLKHAREYLDTVHEHHLTKDEMAQFRDELRDMREYAHQAMGQTFTFYIPGHEREMKYKTSGKQSENDLIHGLGGDTVTGWEGLLTPPADGGEMKTGEAYVKLRAIYRKREERLEEATEKFLEGIERSQEPLDRIATETELQAGTKTVPTIIHSAFTSPNYTGKLTEADFELTADDPQGMLTPLDTSIPENKGLTVVSAGMGESPKGDEATETENTSEEKSGTDEKKEEEESSSNTGSTGSSGSAGNPGNRGTSLAPPRSPSAPSSPGTSATPSPGGTPGNTGTPLSTEDILNKLEDAAVDPAGTAADIAGAVGMPIPGLTSPIMPSMMPGPMPGAAPGGMPGGMPGSMPMTPTPGAPPLNATAPQAGPVPQAPTAQQSSAQTRARLEDLLNEVRENSAAAEARADRAMNDAENLRRPMASEIPAEEGAAPDAPEDDGAPTAEDEQTLAGGDGDDSADTAPASGEDADATSPSAGEDTGPSTDADEGTDSPTNREGGSSDNDSLFPEDEAPAPETRETENPVEAVTRVADDLAEPPAATTTLYSSEDTARTQESSGHATITGGMPLAGAAPRGGMGMGMPMMPMGMMGMGGMGGMGAGGGRGGTTGSKAPIPPRGVPGDPRSEILGEDIQVVDPVINARKKIIDNEKKGQ